MKLNERTGTSGYRSPRAKRPPDISYETEHCVVRDLETSDACGTICNWLSDPDIAKALNAPVRALGMDDLLKYIAGHNRIEGHLLGVFDKRTVQILGLWSVYVDWNLSEFLVNVLIPGNVEGELGAMKETGRPLYAIMFRDLGLQTMRYNVLASNRVMQDRMRLSGGAGIAAPEHISSVASATGSGEEAVQHFRINREQYEEIVARRSERDAAWREARKSRRDARP